MLAVFLSMMLLPSVCAGSLAQVAMAAKVHNASTVLIGDVNGDGFVNAADIVPINRHALGIELMAAGSLSLLAADVNGDGFVNAADIVPINRHALGIELISFDSDTATGTITDYD